MAFDIHDADDDEYWDDEDDEDRDPEEDWENCSCPYCLCLNKTEYGEVCGDCILGAHQG